MAVTLVEGDLPGDLVAALRAERVVAVDTETSGLDWRDSKVQICQLYSPSSGAVVLRNVRGVPSGLAAVMSDPDVLKVFHFAPFDLRFLLAGWQVTVDSVACTKAASKLLHPTQPAGEHSLARLAARYLDVTLDKGAVRTSDWGASTLTDEQLTYAVADVMYLPELLNTLTQKLAAAGLTKDYWDVCRYMPVGARLEVAGIPNPLTY
ncbi:ribonuclease D [Nocardioides sp. SYSU D00065]|uniref:ribonuclease D n=1 Tax=Nocardioides sp. SYSU D00065 TaxID=2817378 RepID=UPI001B339848|nr:ribonuclease D [Nocardioides sp. SYSU D00065]